MSRKLLPVSITAALLGGTAIADVPNVAVDIAPVHSLVARVMDGVGSPDLIVPAGASPHEYNLRPSEAAALQNADLVFWLGEDLTPWMEGAIETLSTGATVTALLEADETELLDFRESALFEAHVHGDEDGHDDHDHGDHAEHATKVTMTMTTKTTTTMITTGMRIMTSMVTTTTRNTTMTVSMARITSMVIMPTMTMTITKGMMTMITKIMQAMTITRVTPMANMTPMPGFHLKTRARG